jgi:hypothetical protein
MANRMLTSLRLGLSALALACLTSVSHAAVITIVNNDGAGEGFNDPTAAAPVGGNTGTTVGTQRLQVFQQAAILWGSILPSAVTIRVNSTFDPLTCTATAAVLGSAGTTEIFSDFPGAEVAGTWYPKALANKLYGADLDAVTADITARFNSGIGGATCLAGTSWYYGFDHNESLSQIDLLAVVQHELGHGLGFATYANGTTGALFNGVPDIFSTFIYDEATGLHWPAESNTQRAASAINTFKLQWDGPATRTMAPLTLASGRPVLRENAPAAGIFAVGPASFGAPLSSPGVTAPVVLAIDDAAPTGDACSAITNAAAMAGKIAIVDRGVCSFTVKVKACQDAGAVGVIVVDNVAGSPPPGMGGSDATVLIPSVRVTLADGTTLKSLIASGLNVTLLADPNLLQGAAPPGRAMLYTPNPFVSGSSVSHFDVTATPNLLMEPAINPDLTASVDLTRYVFEDIGWLPRVTSVPEDGAPVSVATLSRNAPNPFARTTAIRFEIPREGETVLSVYDVSGRVIKHLVNGTMPAGTHVTVWDGRDDAGNDVHAGVYFSRLTVAGVARSQRMVLMK